ncbi:MAG TPA: hypothetical protein DCR20_09615 [Planctomycetaceae bacterium]|nr:hypothetical protein [Planctomycetaceae bacterium]
MSRRMQRAELEFGSDSFLDVVCNIVGILIILIVVVGVRLQRQPRPVDPQPALQAAAAAAEAAAQTAQQNAAVTTASAQRDTLQRDLTALETDERQLEHELQTVATETLTARQESAAAKTQLAERQTQQETQGRREQKLAAERSATTARVASLKNSLKVSEQKHSELEAALRRTLDTEVQTQKKTQTVAVETLQLTEQLTAAQQQTQPADRLNHRLSPVTKPVESDEVHFRVAEGMVSMIPLNDLLDRLKDQVMSRRSTIMRFNQFEGQVGPVSGYSMKYTVEKEGGTALESLQTGDLRVRVSVSKWQLQPEESLLQEPIADALRPGSRFRQQLETCPPDSVVTIWVYENSFSQFAAIRELAHGLRLRVAARPLPEGTPIVGSPNGSRSSAQ